MLDIFQWCCLPYSPCSALDARVKQLVELRFSPSVCPSGIFPILISIQYIIYLFCSSFGHAHKYNTFFIPKGLWFYLLFFMSVNICFITLFCIYNYMCLLCYLWMLSSLLHYKMLTFQVWMPWVEVVQARQYYKDFRPTSIHTLTNNFQLPNMEPTTNNCAITFRDLRDKAMDDKLIYILNDDKHNFPLYRFNFWLC